MHEGWLAPTATGPVDAVVSVPGSKSITNRALVLAALADGPSRIGNALDARDTRLMVDALRALGAQIDVAPADSAGNVDVVITPIRLDAGLAAPVRIDAGLSGTVMRFIAAVAALVPGATTIDGDAQARRRPMAPLTGALRALGVAVEGDALPLTIEGGRPTAGSVTVDASTSSQFVSALLLVGARLHDGLDVRATGAVPSRPHIDMTIAMLAEHGVRVEEPEPGHWLVAPGPIRALDRVVEPDLSNATPFLAAAMATGGTVRIPAWPRQSLQAADAILDVLSRMGASVDRTDDELTLSMHGAIRGIDADLSTISEITPTVAALAALADGPSQLRGIGHLRGHETDRLAALSTELTAIGAHTTASDDGLRIEPGPLHGGVFHAYADHRMATAGAIVGLRTAGIVVDDIACTDKTLPGFTDRWQTMLRSGA